MFGLIALAVKIVLIIFLTYVFVVFLKAPVLFAVAFKFFGFAVFAKPLAIALTIAIAGVIALWMFSKLFVKGS